MRHRVPVRLRHHWRPAALFAVFLVVTMGFFGSSRVVPYITGDDRYAPPIVTENVAGSVDLFDESRSHAVSLTFATQDYERVLRTWYDEGEKEYLQAHAVIDGTRVENVGVRLKGNSTLMTLQDPNAPAAGPGGPPGGARPAAITGEALSADRPEALPWLISFDEFAEGRQYQGRTEIAVRPAGLSSTVALNEALALSLVERTGQVTQDHTYAALTVNDQPTTTRLILEHPDETWTENEFPGDGVLYKSRATSTFTDRGEDPTSHETEFDQINRVGSQNLQPVIELVRWVAQATDEEFAAELGEHVDVSSLARYLATQHLLLNFDDMGGPGKNYYLWYDLGTERFQVVTWDLNLTFGGDAATRPGDPLRMALGGGRAPAGAAPGGGPPGGGPPGAGRGMLVQGNALKDRFLAAPTLRAEYERAYRELFGRMYGDRRASAATATLAAVTRAATAAATPAERDTIARESAALGQTLTTRAAALSRD